VTDFIPGGYFVAVRANNLEAVLLRSLILICMR